MYPDTGLNYICFLFFTPTFFLDVCVFNFCLFSLTMQDASVSEKKTKHYVEERHAQSTMLFNVGKVQALANLVAT